MKVFALSCDKIFNRLYIFIILVCNLALHCIYQTFVHNYIHYLSSWNFFKRIVLLDWFTISLSFLKGFCWKAHQVRLFPKENLLLGDLGVKLQELVWIRLSTPSWWILLSRMMFIWSIIIFFRFAGLMSWLRSGKDFCKFFEPNVPILQFKAWGIWWIIILTWRKIKRGTESIYFSTYKSFWKQQSYIIFQIVRNASSTCSILLKSSARITLP